MPRPERPLEEGDPALTRFASDLRALRERCGQPGYRVLAKRAHYSATTLSDAAGGRRLPSLAVTLAYVHACGGDTTEWENRWHTLAAELAASDTTSDPVPQDIAVVAPYVGLAAFQPTDADRFFGRTAITDTLVERVRTERFVTVFGASGAGKSSILRAGLIARIINNTNTPPVVLLTPGPHPIEECAVALAPLTGESVTTLKTALSTDPDGLHLYIRQALIGHPSEVDLILVIDQFEEIFTLCQDHEERARFITALIRATRQTTSRIRVVVGVRTDFYTHCARDPLLVDALRDAQVLVGPMSAQELRYAITQPALGAGCTVESALLAAVMADCAGEPGVLPLLSHALLETWRRRRGATLSLAGYQASGGITHAIANTADHTYDQLTPTQQRLATALFLRLTALGEGTEDTKRRVHRDELDTDPDTNTTLDHLVRARLITLDHDHIEITHEALIRCWPRLRDWLDQDREGLRVHRQLTDDATTWQSLDRDRDSLYRGSRLATAQDWATTTDTVLSPTERRFLAASLAAASDERTVTRRRTRRLRQLVALLGVLLLAATGVTGYALYTQHIVTQQRDVADAENVARQATALQDTNPALARQLMLAAYHLAPTEQTRSGVLNTADQPYVGTVSGSSAAVEVVAVSPDGHAVATWNNGTVRVWSRTSPDKLTMVATLGRFTGPVTPMAFSPDGHILVAGDSRHVQMWNVSSRPRPVVVATLPTSVNAAAFDADGRMLATSETDGTRLWDITDPHQPVAVTPLFGGDAIGAAFPGAGVAFSPNSRILAEQIQIGPAAGIHLWNITNPRQPVAAAEVTEPGTNGDMSFSPVGSTLAVGTVSGTTQLWDVADPRLPRIISTLVGQSGGFTSTAFSPDGRNLASVSGGSLWVWNVSNPADPHKITTVTGLGDSALLVAFSPDGNALIADRPNGRLADVVLPQFALADNTLSASSASFSPDGHTLVSVAGNWLTREPRSVTELWDVTDVAHPRPGIVLDDGATAATDSGTGAQGLFSPDGRILATAGPRTTDLWNLTDRQNPQILAVIRGIGGQAVFSPDGRTLASGEQVWTIANPRQPRQLPSSLDPVGPLVFSPNGHLLAGACQDGVVRLWNATRPDPADIVARIPSHTDASLAFTPDGHTLAIDEGNNTVQLWNVAEPSRPVILATLSGSANPAGPVVFSLDGHTLATTGNNHTIQLWNINDPTRPDLTATLTDTAIPQEFSPDGHTLAVINTDGTLRLRETDVQHAATRLCALAGPTLNRATWNQYLPHQTYQPPCT